jgi:hypothetical protein
VNGKKELWRILGAKIEEAEGYWRNLHNEEFHDVHMGK